MNNGYRLLSIAIVLAAMGLFSSPAWAKKPEGNSAKASSNDVRANPDLRFSALAISDATSGNNNGFADPNECIELSITLVNNGDKKASGISATLESNTHGITVPTASATRSYPDINTGVTGANSSPFQVSISPAFACGDNINLTLKVTTSQGPFSVPVTLSSGALTQQTFSSISSPVSIPDATKSGAIMPVTVTNVSSFNRIKVKMHLTHTYDADMDITLIGPDGTTTVKLSTDNGGDNDNYGTDCPADGNDTIFDDQGRVSIVNASAPFVGTFIPEAQLSTFKSLSNFNGTWTLKVADDLQQDTGTIDCWSITFEKFQCTAGTGGCSGSAPVLNFDSSTISGGNGDGDVDVNELFDLDLKIKNDGTAPATGVSATLSASTSGVSIGTGTASYPDIAPGAVKSNATHFQLYTFPGFACGSNISLTLHVTTAQGNFSIPFSLQTGSLGAPVSFSSSDTPIAIQDPPSASSESSISVASLTGLIGKATATLHLTHTYDSDLEISLVAPDTTTVDLSSNNGDDGDNYGSNCPASGNDTVFDDSAATLVTEGEPPFASAFRPEEALSKFRTINPNGTWKLRVLDDFALDTGFVECWSITLSPLVCEDAGSGFSFLLFDDFENGMVNWNATKGTWTEANGSLQTAGGSKGIIFAPLPWSPSGLSTCSNCSREVDDIEIGTGEKGKLLITAWSADKHNKAELVFKPNVGKAKVSFKERTGGGVVAKGSAPINIAPGTPFDFAISYDGTKFEIRIDGTLVLTVNSSTAPSGNIGFTIKNVGLKIGEVRIR